MDVRQMLAREESCALKAYPDPLTHGDPWTIGYGHTSADVREGVIWTQLQAETAFSADIARAANLCHEHFDPWFSELNDARQAVLIGMVFQMGMGRPPAAGSPGTGVLGFPKALTAIRDQRWHDALGQLLDSKWARQTPARALRMARQIESGEWQLAVSPTTAQA